MRRAEPCMGTVFSFDLRPPRLPGRVLEDVIGWLHRMDATFSTYRPHSDVCRLRRGERRPDDCAPEVRQILNLCERLREVTHGYFDAYAAGALDPSGVVKGWAVERASAMLRAAGSRNHSVSGGGDVRFAGRPDPERPWRAGIADPARPGSVTAVIIGTDMAVATSGTAERGPHILDPGTGRPARGPLSVTVTGPSLTMADAYATAAFAMGERARDWIESLPGYEAHAVTADGRTWTTTGLCPAGKTSPPETCRHG
jgi:FAD:protein FMN transferase